MHDSGTANLQSSIIEKTSDIKSKIKLEFFDTNRGNEILINKTNLALGDCIGRGNFGCVYKGFLNFAEYGCEEMEEVAVKKLENCEFLHSLKNYLFSL